MGFKRTIWLLTCWLTLPCLFPAPANAYSGGAGTRASPYLLSSKEDILELASRPGDYEKSFLLTADIDMEDAVFAQSVVAPEAGKSGEELFFSGSFNGNGHVIRSFSIAGTGRIGFFGGIGRTGRVMHLGLEEVSFDGPTVTWVGMLADINLGDIVGCYAQGHVAGYGDVGGLVGYHFRGHIFDSFSRGSVAGTAGGVGGLVGNIDWYGVIHHCYAACTLAGEAAAVRGGLVGRPAVSYADRDGFTPGIVGSSFWDVAVSGVSVTARGKGIGLSTDQMHTPSTFLNAQWDFADEQSNGILDIWTHSDGNYPTLSAFSGGKAVVLAGEGSEDSPYAISTPQELAALACYSDYCYGLYDNYFYFNLQADIDLAGTGCPLPLLSVFYGSLTANGHCIRGFSEEGSAGLFGVIHGTVSDLHLEGCVVKAEAGSAGCLARKNQGCIDKCSATGTITGGDTIGGLVGWNEGSLYNSSFSGAVAGDCNVGGLAGRNSGTIRSCYSTAAVVGTDHLGGLVGTNGGTVADCYAKGTVTGDHDVGGLAGHNAAQVSRCYSTGPVTGSSSSGGLIGSGKTDTWYVSDSFWDIDSSGTQTSAGGTGLSQSQMQDVNTFLAAGWDFVGETANGSLDLWLMADNNYPDLTLSATFVHRWTR